MLAWFAEMLPSPPVTRNQVELMQLDNVSSPGRPGFGELGISPHAVEEILQQMLEAADTTAIAHAQTALPEKRMRLEDARCTP